MTVPILCLVCLALLGWVVVLKSTIDGLNDKIARLQKNLEQRLRDIYTSVEVTKARRLSKSELDNEK